MSILLGGKLVRDLDLRDERPIGDTLKITQWCQLALDDLSHALLDICDI